MVQDAITNANGAVSLHLDVQKVSYRFATTFVVKFMLCFVGLPVCDQNYSSSDGLFFMELVE